MSHYVYEITNRENGKKYVGVSTIRNDDIINDGYFGSGKLIKRALRKYGSKSFEKKILCITTKEHAYFLESKIVDSEYVARTDTYNLKVGGEGGSVSGRRGISPSEETRQKIREFNLGRKASLETRRKISEGNKGILRPKDAEYRRKISEGLIGNTNKRGKKISEDAKRKIREARKKQVITEEHKRKVSVFFKGYQHKRVTCDRCGKAGGITGMKRWHFENCKNASTET